MSGPKETTSAIGDSVDFDFARAATLLTDAAARAGAAMMHHYGRGPEVEFKADNSPVTRADRDAEAIVLPVLAELAPNIPVVSEESNPDCDAPLPACFFLVDPLDGTKEFIKQRSDFTVNVALIADGRAVFGLVYAPARALLAVTVAEGSAIEAQLAPSATGAILSELAQKKLQVRSPNPLGLTALVSHSHLDPDTEAFLATLNIVERASAGSSVKFLEIARGAADVYPRLAPTMEWDTAAGQAVLEAAGGEVLDTKGEPLSYGKTDTALRNPSFIAWGSREALTGP